MAVLVGRRCGSARSSRGAHHAGPCLSSTRNGVWAAAAGTSRAAAQIWGAGGWRGLAPGGPDVRSGEGAGPRWAPPGVGGQEGQGGGARMSCLQTPGPRPATRRGPCRPPARCSPGASSTSEGAGHGGGRGSRAQVGMVRPDGLRVEPWWPRAPGRPHGPAPPGASSPGGSDAPESGPFADTAQGRRAHCRGRQPGLCALPAARPQELLCSPSCAAPGRPPGPPRPPFNAAFGPEAEASPHEPRHPLPEPTRRSVPVTGTGPGPGPAKRLPCEHLPWASPVGTGSRAGPGVGPRPGP